MTVEREIPWKDHRDDMLLASILCNDTQRIEGELLGDPTETAYFPYYEKVTSAKQLDYDLAYHPRLAEVATFRDLLGIL